MLRFPILKKHYQKQKGLASIEAIFSLVIFIALLSFSLGFFGVVHSGIVNSIAARNYAFNTFNNRTYLKYHRDVNTSSLTSHEKNNFRLHAIVKEDYRGEDFIVTQRNIAFAKKIHQQKSPKGDGDHIDMVTNEDKEDYTFDPVWVKAAYGICLNVRCRP